MQSSGTLKAVRRRYSVKNPLLDQASQQIQDTMRRAVLNEDSDKVVSLKTGYAPRTANAIRNATQTIPIEGLLRMAAAYPEVARAVSYWMQRMCEPEFFEPESQRDFHAFLNAVSKRVG